MRMDAKLITTALVFFVPISALAHKPSYAAAANTGPEDAWRVEDISVSTVVYRTVSCEAEQFWLTFEGSEGADLWVELGLPKTDWLQDYRPSLAVLAPGLPPPDSTLPFAVPAGLGVRVLHTGAVESPKEFHEPLTQTTSWILLQENITLPAAGRGFIVAFDPNRQTGKLWVAVGKEEDFGPADFAQLPSWIDDTREFHEVWPYNSNGRHRETCPSDHGDEAHVGCSAGGGGAGVAWWMAALALFHRGHRQRRQSAPR